MITFDEKSHTYVNSSTREKYTSATTVIGKFKKPFDSEKMSAIVAKKRGITKKEVLAEWDATRDAACEYGTHVHNILESWINKEPYTDDGDYVETLSKVIDLSALRDVVPEQKLWLHQYKIAGTTDVLHNRGKTFDLYDFKTNRKFNFTNQYGEYMLGPLSHMPACEYSTYSLQLSLYAYMQETLTGQRAGSLTALWLDRDTKIWHKYPTPYLKKEVIAMLEAFSTL